MFDISEIDFELLKKRGPNSFQIKCIDLNDKYVCYLAASVLSLRGINVCKQPITDEIYRNYLLWNGEIFSSDLVNVNSNENDGLKLYECLSKCQNEDDIFEIISSIKGPYAFLYFDFNRKIIYFGRDRIGRRSLLINEIITENSTIFMLSSVRVFQTNSQKQYEFNELKANGIYKIDLNSRSFKIDFIEWRTSVNSQSSINHKLIDNISLFNDSLVPIQRSKEDIEEIKENFLKFLKQSVMRRVTPLPNLCKKCFSNDINKFNEDNTKCEHSKVAILFSGGIDSAVIAALADQCLPEDESIDLLNIAFEQSSKINGENNYLVPDRVSGKECLKELNSKRKWNFVEINVTYDELKESRAKLIKNLIYPLDTVLDDSIGCAIWFASKGSGYLNNELYQSNAEVLLLGMGADEQLAGYARHRTRYRHEGWLGLVLELKMEMKRISERNLGRDDRILSDHGKESRLPFLDEDFIDYVNKLQIFDKVDFNLPKGLGEKYLLRCCASEKLGLHFASKLPKRAIQFGSRVAKLENSKEKASDKCQRLADDE